MHFLIDMCLLCHSNTNGLINIETCDSFDVTIKSKIVACITEKIIVVSESNVPLAICFECYGKLNFLYGFQQTCTKNVDTFTNFVSKVGLENNDNYKSLSVNLQDDNRNEKLKKNDNIEDFFQISMENKKSMNNSAQRKIYRNNKIKIHASASKYLKNEIFPNLKNDEITKCISDDEVAIKYGNKLCEKLHTVSSPLTIRARLRLLGRFLIEVKKIDKKITDLKSVFLLRRFESTMSAAQKLATSSNTASHIKLIIKQILIAMIAYCIKNSLPIEKSELGKFLIKWKAEFHFFKTNNTKNFV